MANVKRVEIEAEVPFHWTQALGSEELISNDDLAFMAMLFLSPSIGLELSYEDLGDRPNDGGGRTSMYLLRISGEEAISWPALDRLADVVHRATGQLGELRRAFADDIEGGTDGGAPIGSWVKGTTT